MWHNQKEQVVSESLTPFDNNILHKYELDTS